MMEENDPHGADLPRNFIARSMNQAQRDHLEFSSPGSSSTGPSFSRILGNIILLLILLFLLAIPILIFFTGMGPRAKQELKKVLAAMESGAAPAEVQEELNAAREEMALLRERLITAEGASTTLEEELQAARAAGLAAETAAQKAVSEAEERAKSAQQPTATQTVPTLPRKEYEVAKLFSGVGVRGTLDLQPGGTASQERAKQDSYEFEMSLKVAVPEANRSMAELAALNPHLPSILPGLEGMLPTAKVSPLFTQLYENKHGRIKSNLSRLDRLETRHNYFDTETMLELTHSSGNQVLFVQGEMDVVADGSDGDRMPTVDDYISLSRYYQPTTSYGWRKLGKVPNPLLPRLEKELYDVEEEYKIVGLSAERNRYLVNRRDDLKRLISDLRARSYLIAEADPFIVLSLSAVLGRKGTDLPAPLIGDYAVVIYGDKVYPAICGDAGPSWKFGEASLMMAKTINENASPYSRPVSDLKVSYLIFPGSREESNSPPDLARWTRRCSELLGGIGGLGPDVELHEWRDFIAERKARRDIVVLAEKAESQGKELSSLVASLGSKASAEAEKAKSARSAWEAGKAKAAAPPATNPDGSAPAATP
ncbi:MAG: glycoside hydrolase family 75 protein, partial [Verrucomicrobiota bacterium]